jgi:hypothetical protein
MYPTLECTFQDHNPRGRRNAIQETGDPLDEGKRSNTRERQKSPNAKARQQSKRASSPKGNRRSECWENGTTHLSDCLIMRKMCSEGF